jgi:hypothetical protein
VKFENRQSRKPLYTSTYESFAEPRAHIGHR